MLAVSAGSASLLILGVAFMVGATLGRLWSRRRRPDTAVRRSLRQPEAQYHARLLAVGVVFVILGLIVAAVE